MLAPANYCFCIKNSVFCLFPARKNVAPLNYSITKNKTSLDFLSVLIQKLLFFSTIQMKWSLKTISRPHSWKHRTQNQLFLLWSWVKRICDVQQPVLIPLQSSTSTLTSNQCWLFLFLHISDCGEPVLPAPERRINVHCIPLLSLYRGKNEQQQGDVSSSAGLSACCRRHSDVEFLMFLQTLDLRGGRDTLDTEIFFSLWIWEELK